MSATNDPKLVAYQRNILDNLSTAVVLLSSALDIEYINSASENLFQISSRQATGDRPNKIMIGEPELEKRV